jgi:hypothetical protein
MPEGIDYREFINDLEPRLLEVLQYLFPCEHTESEAEDEVIENHEHESSQNNRYQRGLPSPDLESGPQVDDHEAQLLSLLNPSP